MKLCLLPRLILSLVMFAAALPVVAQAGPSYAIRAGRVYPVSPEHPHVISDAVIIVRDGRIAAIGRDLDIPVDLRVYDWRDAVIIPGLVAASTDAGGTHRGDESIGAGYAAVDAFDQYADYRDWLAGGVTTIHMNPGWHRLVTGQGAVMRLAGPAEGRVLRATSDLTINLGPGAGNPPGLVDLLIPPTGDSPISPAQPQRPTTRMTQYLALKEAIEKAARGEHTNPFGKFDMHLAALEEAWQAKTPLRVQAQAAADLSGAIAFFHHTDRTGYFVGGREAALLADELRAAGFPLVYTIDPSFRSPAGNLGADPAARDALGQDLAKLEGVRVALALAPGQPLQDLRLAAAVARRSGWSEMQVLEAITRIPAEVLGVADRVGSLAPGREADFLVLTGEPLATTTHVSRAYVGGRIAYDAHARKRGRQHDEGETLIVKAETIWLGPDQWLHQGEVLIENGTIRAVGKRVAAPPHARVINGGPGSFVTPGMIDARGHLGLEGDRMAPAPELSFAPLYGPADDAAKRIAHAGVTTVIVAPYGIGGAGAQMTAVKTDGETREDRVLSPTAGVLFDVGNTDYRTVGNAVRARLEAGKRYLKTWEDYEKALAEWETKRAEGQVVEAPVQTQEEVTEEGRVDPITGTWSARVFGGPLPQEFQGRVTLRLTGNSIEGRIIEPEVPSEVKFIGTLNGRQITGTVDVDTGGLGTPTWSATLGDDTMTGQISLAGMATVNFEANRVDKGGVEFRVTRTRRATTGRDGRPLPPKVDEALEPIRRVLEKKIPIVIAINSSKQIEALLEALKEYGLHVTLVNAPGASMHASLLKERGVGVVLPTSVLRRDDFSWYHQGDDLSRAGVSIAFQSDAEDGARSLPLVALFAVERGLSAESALAALTIDAARMYRLDDRIGSIAPGRDGDLVIFNGHPFDAASRVERVIVGGREVQP